MKMKHECYIIHTSTRKHMVGWSIGLRGVSTHYIIECSKSRTCCIAVGGPVRNSQSSFPHHYGLFTIRMHR